MTRPAARHTLASLAEWATGRTFADASLARERAVKAFVDTIGCLVAGLDEEAASLARQALTGRSDGLCLALPDARTRPEVAALLNATAAHALDFDDHETLGMTHPSAVLVPALLALGEVRRASGRQLVDAYIAGYEVLARIGARINPAHYVAGWHATSTVGALGAAAACGHLLSLDAGRLAHAVGLACSMAGGLRCQFGTAAKPLQAGLAAQAGVVAASLAARGMTASPAALDGPYGLTDMMVPDSAWRSDALPEPGKGLAIEGFGPITKRYPSCAATHRTLDAVLDLMATHRLAPGDILAVETELPAAAASALPYAEPRDGMEARFSMPYCVAVAVDSGAVRLADFRPGALVRPFVRRRAKTVVMRSRAAEGNPFAPGSYCVRTFLRLKNDRVLEDVRIHPRGAPECPLEPEEIHAKFMDCTTHACGDTTAGDLYRRLSALDAVEDIAEVTQALVAALTPQKQEVVETAPRRLPRSLASPQHDRSHSRAPGVPLGAAVELAGFVEGMQPEDVPQAAFAAAERSTLDTIAAALGGVVTRNARTARDAARAIYGPGGSDVWFAGESLRPAGAVFANCSSASALDVDDGHRGASGHPGAAIVPAAIVEAASQGRNGRDLLAAVAIGYDVALRVAAARRLEPRMSYASGRWVGFGVAAAVGWLRRLPKEVLLHAITMAGAEAPRNFPQGDSQSVSSVKGSSPWATVTAFAAVDRARYGGTGPVDLLDRDHAYDRVAITTGLGERWLVTEAYMKPYASCRYTHPVIDAVLALRAEMAVPPAAIDRIAVEIFPEARNIANEVAPPTLEAAQFSIPFTAALAAVHGAKALRPLEERSLSDPVVLCLAQRVEISYGGGFATAFPAQTPARVTMVSGERRKSTVVHHPWGDVANPMNRRDLEAKLRDLGSGLLAANAMTSLIDAVARLSEGDVAPLLRQLALPAEPVGRKVAP